ncbi:cation diffusion facilitator family transporter [Paenibacillus sp. 1P07SE]|uniref:cation diffusion facilitator family transporter n=1 Tax=Paenibacillus sp. 1P07SE TaxID=3132209 RepID=UPI0039A62CE3
MVAKPRYAEAEAAATTGLAGNSVLALFKGAAGILAGSPALLADAVRSAAEAAACFAAAVGLRKGRQLPSHSSDKKTVQRSQSRIETASGVIISVLLLLLGLEIAIQTFRAVMLGVDAAPHWAAIAVILVSMIVQQLAIPSKSRRTDLLASAVALVGIAGALCGEVFAMPMLYYLDPAAAFIIAIIVLMSGYRLISGLVLQGHKLSLQEEDAEELMQTVQRIEGVITVEDLKAWEQGHYVAVELRISVNPRISVLEGQEIAKRVRELLLKRFIHISDVYISVDPYDPGYPYKSNHDPNQESMPTLLQ